MEYVTESFILSIPEELLTNPRRVSNIDEDCAIRLLSILDNHKTGVFTKYETVRALLEAAPERFRRLTDLARGDITILRSISVEQFYDVMTRNQMFRFSYLTSQPSIEAQTPAVSGSAEVSKAQKLPDKSGLPLLRKVRAKLLKTI